MGPDAANKKGEYGAKSKDRPIWETAAGTTLEADICRLSSDKEREKWARKAWYEFDEWEIRRLRVCDNYWQWQLQCAGS